MVTINWGAFVIGILILAAGAYIVWSTYQTHIIIQNSKNWPVTIGDVTAAKIDKTTNRGHSSYQPDITYQYTVYGIEYIRFIRKKSTSQEDVAQKILESFPVGAPVKVSYNPANPKDCVSEHDEEGIPWIGLVMIIFGFLLIISAFIPNTTGLGRGH